MTRGATRGGLEAERATRMAELDGKGNKGRCEMGSQLPGAEKKWHDMIIDSRPGGRRHQT